MKKIRHISDLTLDLNDEISSRYGKPKELAITCLPSIDDKLYGLKKKKLIVIAGRVSMGKSALLMELAWCFANQGKKIMFFNLETTNIEFMERLYSHATKTDNFSLKCGKATVEPEYAKKMNEFQTSSTATNLFISESYGRSFNEIVEVIEQTGDDYDCIFIDYLQKIKMAGRKEREQLDDYLDKLTELAIDKNICIILGSQINRGTYDGKKAEPPMLHELKGSGGIEEKAHQVWLLHWAWWYDQEKEKTEYRIHIAKNKDGRTGVMNVRFRPEHYEIYESTDLEERVNNFDPFHD